MPLEGSTLYYKKMHSIVDWVCMNTYDDVLGGDDDRIMIAVEVLKCCCIPIQLYLYLIYT